jgi:hypothetical protein
MLDPRNWKFRVCVLDHDTPEHRERIIEFLKDDWQVLDAEDLVAWYPLPVLVHACLEFRRRKPEGFRSPSGFFMSRLRQLKLQWDEGKRWADVEDSV